jgi:hypothetical protein
VQPVAVIWTDIGSCATWLRHGWLGGAVRLAVLLVLWCCWGGCAWLVAYSAFALAELTVDFALLMDMSTFVGADDGAGVLEFECCTCTDLVLSLLASRTAPPRLREERAMLLLSGAAVPVTPPVDLCARRLLRGDSETSIRLPSN